MCSYKMDLLSVKKPAHHMSTQTHTERERERDRQIEEMSDI